MSNEPLYRGRRASRRAAKARRSRDQQATGEKHVKRNPNLQAVQDGWLNAAQQNHELNGRIALALSILQHRHFCEQCHPHVSQARQALLGASVDEIRDGADAG